MPPLAMFNPCQPCCGGCEFSFNVSLTNCMGSLYVQDLDTGEICSAANPNTSAGLIYTQDINPCAIHVSGVFKTTKHFAWWLDGNFTSHDWSVNVQSLDPTQANMYVNDCIRPNNWYSDWSTRDIVGLKDNHSLVYLQCKPEPCCIPGTIYLNTATINRVILPFGTVPPSPYFQSFRFDYNDKGIMQNDIAKLLCGSFTNHVYVEFTNLPLFIGNGAGITSELQALQCWPGSVMQRCNDCSNIAWGGSISNTIPPVSNPGNVYTIAYLNQVPNKIRLCNCNNANIPNTLYVTFTRSGSNPPSILDGLTVQLYVNDLWTWGGGILVRNLAEYGDVYYDITLDVHGGINDISLLDWAYTLYVKATKATGAIWPGQGTANVINCSPLLLRGDAMVQNTAAPPDDIMNIPFQFTIME